MRRYMPAHPAHPGVAVVPVHEYALLPVWITQTMLTLAASTAGPALLSLGAGEVHNINLFGRKRSLGLKRLGRRCR